MSTRKILFRGQTRRKGEKTSISGKPLPGIWVTGGIFPQNKGYERAIIYTQDPKVEKHVVYAETVGQYTGVDDVLETPVFEDDIITFWQRTDAKHMQRYKGTVKYDETLTSFTVVSCEPNRLSDPVFLWDCSDIHVVGNVFDGELSNCSDEHQMEDVLFRFISVCKNVSPRVLVQLINHFRNRNNPVQLATGKANGAGSAALDREVEPISDVMCNRVARDIFNQLWQVLRAEDTEPKSIYIDPACHCNKLIFPDNPRQISSAMRATACGSRTQLPDGNVLRAFLYWKGDDGTDLWDGIDLDLSVVFYGEKEANFVFYGEPKDERLGAIHSGDRRCSGPHGAVEYVDFDIKKCLQNGIRYAALVVNSYSGEKFSEMDAAFCGVMVRDGETGEQFEPATVKDRFALTTDVGQIIMVVIDLLNREVVTVDKSIAQVRVACRNVVTDYAPTVDICSYAMQLKSLSIKEMLGMRYAKFLKQCLKPIPVSGIRKYIGSAVFVLLIRNVPGTNRGNIIPIIPDSFSDVLFGHLRLRVFQLNRHGFLQTVRLRKAHVKTVTHGMALLFI